MASVGVVIPTRDRPDLLRAAVTSVLEQDHDDMYLVIVDEASDPPVATTVGLLSDPRVSVLRNDHAVGPGGARNQGARALTTDLIAFLDDDDIWLPGKLEMCTRILAANPRAGAVAHRASFSSRHAPGTGRSREPADPVRHMLLNQPPHVDCVVVRRHVHQAVEFDEAFPAGADLDYMLRLAQTAPVVLIDMVLAVHRPGSPAVSEIALERRIAGREMFRMKHLELFDRRANAFFALRLGHQFRRAGRPLRAAREFVRSIALWPFDLRPWSGLIASTLPRRAVARLAAD